MRIQSVLPPTSTEAGGRPQPGVRLHRATAARKQCSRWWHRCRIPQMHRREDPAMAQPADYTGAQLSLYDSVAAFTLLESTRSIFAAKVVFLATRKDSLALSLGEIGDPLRGRFSGLGAPFGVA